MLTLQRSVRSPGDVVALTEADGVVDRERIDGKGVGLLLLLTTRLGEAGWLAEPEEEMERERTSPGSLELERLGEEETIALEELVDETLVESLTSGEGVELCEALRLDDWVRGGVKVADAVAVGDGVADPLVVRLGVAPCDTVADPLTVAVRVAVLVIICEGLCVREDVSLMDAVLEAEAEFDGLRVDVTVGLFVELGVEDTVQLCVCGIVAETDREGELEGDVDRVNVRIAESVCELDGVDACVAVANCERVKVSEADAVSDELTLPLGVADGLGVRVPLEVWVGEGVCARERVWLADGEPDSDAVSDVLGDCVGL